MSNQSLAFRGMIIELNRQGERCARLALIRRVKKAKIKG